MSGKIDVYEEKMQKSISNMVEGFQGIRAGRANPHVLDKIMVDYYGAPTPIQQTSNITIPEARIIQIQPFDPKMLKQISKAIMASDVGITPIDDGHVIRLVFPELTEERRKDIAKDVKKKGEDTKVAIRNIRRDGNDALKKLKKSKAADISEDQIADLEDKLQELTDKYIKEVDEKVKDKTEDIMTV